MLQKAITIESLPVNKERQYLSSMMNETKFEAFYNEHSRPLWAYVRRLAGNAELADDIMQESFLRFLSAPSRANLNKKHIFTASPQISSTIIFAAIRAM